MININTHFPITRGLFCISSYMLKLNSKQYTPPTTTNMLDAKHVFRYKRHPQIGRISNKNI